MAQHFLKCGELRVESGVVVAPLYFIKWSDFVCETNSSVKGKELIISDFTDSENKNSVRRLSLVALADC